MLQGTQVGAYRVLQQIGEGGMGSVWLAEHIALGRRAALKMLHPEMSMHQDIVARFFNEARTTTAITDPGIVQIFDFGQHIDGRAYIVMELLEGEPLDRRLKRHGALSLFDGLRLMRQVASTLGAAHIRGIIHRDLKPENIFIVRDPEVPGGERAKVLDFGIAKLVGDQVGVRTHTSAVMGTPAFMSPEQCRGAGRVDQRSDIYALGCVLFALVVGRPPFVSDGAGEIIAMQLREQPPAPSQLRPGIPQEIDQLVLRCLAKEPAQRFQTAADLAAAIGTVLGTMYPVPTMAAVGRAYAVTTLSGASGTLGTARTTRGRAGLMAAVIGLGALGVVTVLFAVRNREPAVPASEPPPAAPASAAPSPTPVPPVTPAPPPAPAPMSPPAAPLDSKARVAPAMKDSLTRFRTWSTQHQGDPCPTAAALGAMRDPWGNAMQVTCTDQPGDQVAGVISAGPDGAHGTEDDIASWQLGREVTDLMRGARWQIAPRTQAIGQNPAPAAKPITGKTRPTESKPVEPARTPKKPLALELDDNGLPIHR